jgi:hypothetical protein
METEWIGRLTSVVFPALLEGIPIYTGFGELHPGHGIPKGASNSEAAQMAVKMKPIGLPDWQVYLGEKPNQPAIRFLQLVQKVRNPVGSATMVYPTRIRDEKLGFPLIVPLGEGLETPESELTAARDLMATVMFKPVRLIALGRVRFFTTTSPWSLPEPVVLEVYSEPGQRIWTNSYIGMSLEEAIARLRSNDQFQTKVHTLVPKFDSVRDKRQAVNEGIQNLAGQGCSDVEIVAYLGLIHGIGQLLASRIIKDFRNRKEYPPEIVTLVRHCAQEFAACFEGNELMHAVADACDQEVDVVIDVLGSELNAPWRKP